MSNKVTITGISTSELPRLSAKETAELLLAVHGKAVGESGLPALPPEVAREKLIMANARLVLSLVQRFRNTKENKDDLFQVGILGLIKSIDNFDVTLNVRFSTYAVPMILGEIRRYIREGSALKVGRSIRDIAYQAVKAREKLELLSLREASLTEIAQEIGVEYREVVSALDAIAEPVSIYEQVFCDNEDGMEVIDQIKDNRAEFEYEDIITLRDGLTGLAEKEQKVLIYRYYSGLTQTEIATTLSISQAQVSRLEKTAIDKLRLAF